MFDSIGEFFGRKPVEKRKNNSTPISEEYKTAVLPLLSAEIERITNLPDKNLHIKSIDQQLALVRRDQILLQSSQYFEQLDPHLKEIILGSVDRLNFEQHDLKLGQSSEQQTKRDDSLELYKKALRPLMSDEEYYRYFPPQNISNISDKLSQKDKSLSRVDVSTPTNVIDITTKRPLVAVEVRSSEGPRPPAA